MKERDETERWDGWWRWRETWWDELIIYLPLSTIIYHIISKLRWVHFVLPLKPKSLTYEMVDGWLWDERLWWWDDDMVSVEENLKKYISILPIYHHLFSFIQISSSHHFLTCKTSGIASLSNLSSNVAPSYSFFKKMKNERLMMVSCETDFEMRW